MVEVIEKAGSLLGQLGRGFGGGMAGQAPKEMEQYRLSQGLNQFENDHSKLTPLQQLTRLSSIPGITPQMVQSFSDIARSQQYGEALKNYGRSNQPEQPQPSPFPKQEKPQGGENNAKSITTTPPVKATIENYIPKSYDDILSDAGQMYNSNPALFQNDPQKAVQAAAQKDQQEQARNSALQQQRTGQQDVQSRAQAELAKQRESRNANLPENIYQDIENDALDRVRKGEMTELEAGKYYGKELDKISRQYEAIKTTGTAKIITKSAAGNKANLRAIRDDFKKRNDLENFADTLIDENNLSPSKAYYLAYQVSDNKELNNALYKIPKLKTVMPYEKGFDPENSRNKTMEIAPKIAKAMGKEESPLAIAEELSAKGYDPQAWMEYLDTNRKKLDLGERQGRELQKGRDFFPTIDDLWMFYWSGLDPLSEQE